MERGQRRGQVRSFNASHFLTPLATEHPILDPGIPRHMSIMFRPSGTDLYSLRRLSLIGQTTSGCPETSEEMLTVTRKKGQTRAANRGASSSSNVIPHRRKGIRGAFRSGNRRSCECGSRDLLCAF
jgi:hypothetical protein